MRSIIRGLVEDADLLTEIARLSFVASHQNVVPEEVIEEYVGKNFTVDCLRNELNSSENIYHIIFDNNQPAGYSKIIFDSQHTDIPHSHVTKLQRIYLLKEFYGSGAGSALFDFNLELSKQQKQLGMWLYVWKENHRAIEFYQKRRFKVIGSYDFKLTEAHSNPNHLMFLQF